MQEDQGGDWLVSKLQALIDTAFRMTTGNMEALRVPGLLLLKVLLLYLPCFSMDWAFRPNLPSLHAMLSIVHENHARGTPKKPAAMHGNMSASRKL